MVACIFSIYLVSCGMKTSGVVLVPGVVISGQPPVWSISTFKQTLSPEPPEIAFGYLNNTFEPFKFVNLNITQNFISFEYSTAFGNAIQNKKVIIWGSGWRFCNTNANFRDIFWVGKIVDISSNTSIITFSFAGNQYKTIGGTNFVARFITPSFYSNLESSASNTLVFAKTTSGNYTQADFNNPNEDFRSVAFINDNTNNSLGVVVGRNIVFYSRTNESINLTNWRNGLNINITNRPSDFIAFDTVPASISQTGFLIVGSNISETSGLLTFFTTSTNNWSSNFIDTFAQIIGANNYPLYSSDFIFINVGAAVAVGRNIIIFWNDSNLDQRIDPNDVFIFHRENNVSFYGGCVIKDNANNNTIIAVGYDDQLQEGVIYRGQGTGSNYSFNQPPQKVNISSLGLDLRNIIFFDVASIQNNVYVVGCDFSNCDLKPYPQSNPNLPKVTKSFIFNATAFPALTDNHILDTFRDVRGLIIRSSDGGQVFTLFADQIR